MNLIGGIIITKTALVTGGTSGIGLATVKKFLNEGFAVTALSFNDGGHTAEPQALGDYTFKEGDVTDAKRVEEIIAQLVDQYGQLDVVANVAGSLGNHTPFVEADLDNIHKVLDVNLMGTIIVDQKAGAQMVKQGSGVIVNVGSIDGLMANFESIGYMATLPEASAINGSTIMADDGYTLFKGVDLPD
ncbi:SDR family oxidoreductase [Limosilactobacillus fermentum]|nr:SDR family oxidoreductase [Limosilactobacillus fermentum]